MTHSNDTTILLAAFIICIFTITAIFGGLIYFQEQQISQMELQAGNTNLTTHSLQYELELSKNRILQLEYQMDVLTSPKIDYYAYGDSITRATGDDRYLNPDGSGAYIIQMVREFNLNATALHNVDGGGMDSSWGVANLRTHYINNTSVFVYMFTNDANDNLTVNQTIDNYIVIYDYVTSQGTKAVPCIPILRCSNKVAYSLKNQTERNMALESALTSRGIKFVRMYNALNGGKGDINTTYLYDGVHPSNEGQKIMGEYLWAQLVQM